VQTALMGQMVQTAQRVLPVLPEPMVLMARRVPSAQRVLLAQSVRRVLPELTVQTARLARSVRRVLPAP